MSLRSGAAATAVLAWCSFAIVAVERNLSLSQETTRKFVDVDAGSDVASCPLLLQLDVYVEPERSSPELGGGHAAARLVEFQAGCEAVLEGLQGAIGRGFTRLALAAFGQPQPITTEAKGSAGIPLEPGPLSSVSAGGLTVPEPRHPLAGGARLIETASQSIAKSLAVGYVVLTVVIVVLVVVLGYILYLMYRKKAASSEPQRRVTLREQASPISPARGPTVPTPPLSQATPGLRGALRRSSADEAAVPPPPPTKTLPPGRTVPHRPAKAVVPILVPGRVRPNEEVQLIVPNRHVLSECRRSGSTFDVLDGSSRKVFNAYIGSRRGRRTLELAEVGHEEDPFCTVCGPDPSNPSIFMEVLGAKYELFGILEFNLGKSTALLRVEGQHVMSFNFEDQKWSAHAPSGDTVAIASMISSVQQYWRLVVEPRNDSVLICACILGGVLLRISLGNSPSVAGRMPKSYNRATSAGDVTRTMSGASAYGESVGHRESHLEREPTG